MRIQPLCDKRVDMVFIAGTGASMRVFPLESLKGAFIIGLNQFWKYHPAQLMLTVHPELLDEYEAATPDLSKIDTKWVVKKKSPRADLSLDDPRYYVFNTSEDWTTLARQPEDTLFLGRGIQCTALDLAARMGAKVAILIGCDACALSGEHHGHEQHVRFLGVQPDLVYEEYRKYTAKTRRILREEFGMHVLTLSPFIGLDEPQEDYDRLCKEFKLPKLARPKDVSPYTRPSPKRE